MTMDNNEIKQCKFCNRPFSGESDACPVCIRRWGPSGKLAVKASNPDAKPMTVSGAS